MSRFFRVIIVAILVIESLSIVGLDLAALFFVILFGILSLYSWFDYKLFG